jgi:uncharacterized protein
VTQYIDSSALLKRYVDEADSDRAEALLAADTGLVTGRHTLVEVRRNLARLLRGTALSVARRTFMEDLAAISVVEIDHATAELAATIAEQTGVRTLDALHLGAATRVGQGMTFLTFDVRQSSAAKALGFRVVGAH